MTSLSRVNEFLKTKQKAKEENKETNIIFNGPDTIKNILVNETVKLGRLEEVSNILLGYITDPKEMKRLTQKEKRELLQLICSIQSNSRDFIFKITELAAKNSLLQEAFRTLQDRTEIIQTQNGDTYISSVNENTRKELTELLREVTDEQIRFIQ